VDAALLRRARDGAVLPIANHRDDLVLGPVRIPVTSWSWEPIEPRAPDADYAGSSQGAGLLASSGTGAAATIQPGLAEIATAPDDPELAAVEQQADAAVAGEQAEPRPALHTFTGTVPTTDTPRRDAYALRLVTGRALYDGGITVAASDSLAALPREPELLVHPQDRDRIGVEDGAEVKVTSARGSLQLPLRAHPGIEVGTAFVPFNLPGAGVGELVELGAAVTDLRVESRS
jgi:anaerobic selenocysteine-containing dehydrogenase